MSFEEEFKIVDYLLDSKFETRGVDAFSLSLIKSERQIRKLFTFMVYQSDAFRKEDVPALRRILAENDRIYFEGFERGINEISFKKIPDLIGVRYGELSERMKIATKHRNKIFHGQLSGDSLARELLEEFIKDIRSWCQLLSVSCMKEFGYDGFQRSSYRKTELDLRKILQIRFPDVGEYEKFITEFVQRPPRLKHA